MKILAHESGEQSYRNNINLPVFLQFFSPFLLPSLLQSLDIAMDILGTSPEAAHLETKTLWQLSNHCDIDYSNIFFNSTLGGHGFLGPPSSNPGSGNPGSGAISVTINNTHKHFAQDLDDTKSTDWYSDMSQV